MIGDKLTYFKSYSKITNFVISALQKQLENDQRLCISVGGESGCGKTSLAYALKVDIEKELGLKCFLFHLDDYFKLPPKTNHNKRLEDIKNVGESEVNLELLDQNIETFKTGKKIKKPLVNYEENIISSEAIESKLFDFCIIEGTYSSVLKSPDYRVFIDKTYLNTRKHRVERARDLINDFNEAVLNIEHNIIKKHKALADYIVTKDLNILTN